MLFYEILSCPERSIELLRTLDIKSIQHDTLGFLYAKILLNYHNSDLTQDFFTGALNFYCENLRESKESILACLKNGAFDKIEEFEEYDQWLDFSYFKQICFFTKLESFVKALKIDEAHEMDINYYIDFIQKRTEKTIKLTWNIDMKILKPCFFGNETWNFLDLFNNYQFFQINFLRIQLENFMRKTEKNDKIEGFLNEFSSLINTINLEKLYDFSGFRSKNTVKNVNPDVFTKEILKKRLVFEKMNLDLEKNLFKISIKLLKFTQEEAFIEEILKEFKELSKKSFSFFPFLCVFSIKRSK